MKAFFWPRVFTAATLFALPLACGGSAETEEDSASGDGDGDVPGDGDSGDGDTASGGVAGDGDADGGSPSGDGDGDGDGTPGGGGGGLSGACFDETCPGDCAPLDADASTCDEAWSCSDEVACSRDLVSYCGCDGETFEGSSNCAPLAYAHRGACDEETLGARSCDASQVVTDNLPPECEYGYLPEVIEGTWGDCVPINECGCESSGSQDQCGLEYVCYTAGYCGHLLTKVRR